MFIRKHLHFLLKKKKKKKKHKDSRDKFKINFLLIDSRITGIIFPLFVDDFNMTKNIKLKNLIR